MSAGAVAWAISIPPLPEESEVGDAYEQQEEGQHVGHRRGGAHVELAQTGLGYVDYGGSGLLARRPLRDDVGLAEHVRLAQDGYGDDEEEHGPQARDGDVQEPLPGVGAVHGRGLVEVARDVLEAGQVDHGVEAERPPYRRPDERDPGPRQRRDPGYGPDPELPEVEVHQPHVRVEQEPPEDPDNRHAEDVRREENAAEEGPPAELLVQHERHEQRYYNEQRHGEQGVLARVLHAVPEGAARRRARGGRGDGGAQAPHAAGAG